MPAAPARGSTAWSAAALLVASCLLFSLVGVLVKLLSSTYSAGELVFYRSLVGMVCMAAYARWMGIGLTTPVPGLFVNCGWGTGGFKATPGSGHVFAATIAKGEPHPIAAPFRLDRFRTGQLIDEAAAAAVSH